MSDWDQTEPLIRTRRDRSQSDLDLIKAAVRGDFLINALCDPDFGDLEAIAKALPDESSVPGVAEFTAALDAVIAAKTQTKEPL